MCELPADWAGHGEQLLMPMVSSSWVVSTVLMNVTGSNVLVASVVAGGSVTLRSGPTVVVTAAGTRALAVVGGHCIAGPTLSGGLWLLCSLLGSL